MRHFFSSFLIIVSLGLFVSCTNEEEVVETLSNVSVEGVIIKDGYYTDTRDGNKYRIIDVDGTYWFAENLRYDDSVAMPDLKGNMWCYDNKADSCKVYGPLYSFEVAQDVCPEGWTVPGTYQWQGLESYINMANMYGYIEKSGTTLKSVKGWEKTDSIPQGTNRVGFNALPGGRRSVEGGFLPSGKYAFFWGAEPFDWEIAYGWTLSYNKDVLEKGEFYKDHGMSVRCISAKYYDGGRVEFTLDGDLDDSYIKEIPATSEKLEYKGQKYSTMPFNGSIIMTENLNYETGNSWCYNGKKDSCDVYGRLYDYETAGSVCPEGWSLLPFEKFKKLGELFSSAYLRAEGYWHEDNAKDIWGMSIMPAGGYEMDTETFYDLGFTSYFWAKDSLGETCVTSLKYYESCTFCSCTPAKEYAQRAYSVRCIKD